MCSALEDEDCHAASIVHVKGVLSLSGHIEGESFAHNNVPRGSKLLVDLLLGVLAGSLDRKRGSDVSHCDTYLSVDACSGHVLFVAIHDVVLARL